MAFVSETGLVHVGGCEEADGVTYEEVYESAGDPGKTFRICRLCPAVRTAVEDEYGLVVLPGNPHN